MSLASVAFFKYTFTFTVTLHVAFDPSCELAVIIAEPAFLAVTFPLLFTLATLGLLELHLTVPVPPDAESLEAKPSVNFKLLELILKGTDGVPGTKGSDGAAVGFSTGRPDG